MNIRNCKFCNTLFRYIGYGECICENCKIKEANDIKRIKEYLEENPSANAKEISNELEISLKRIMYHIEQGSIIVKTSTIGKNCPRCGKIIDLKEKYCGTCKNELIKGFTTNEPMNENKTQNKSTSPKMRFLDDLNK